MTQAWYHNNDKTLLLSMDMDATSLLVYNTSISYPYKIYANNQRISN